jgi:HrpA-like RNA helicase
MSATFNCQKFSEYFSLSLFGTMITGAPIVTIDKRMKYKVSEYYTEDIKQLGIVRTFVFVHIDLIVSLYSFILSYLHTYFFFFFFY